VAPAHVLVLGGGVVGANAAKMAAGLGGQVTIIDKDLHRLRYLEDIMPKNVTFLMSIASNIADRLPQADLVICAALLRGGRCPVLITRKMLKTMKPGSVIVDVAIDQGGCCETSKPTTHAKPTYIREGVVHYCVTNIPGAVPITSTYGLTNATLPYVLDLAKHGLAGAVAARPALGSGVNIFDGEVTSQPVAEALDLSFTPLADLLE